MKECFKCNKVKGLSEFYKHSEMKDGHVNKCKECNKLDVQRNYAQNREHYREYDMKRNRLDLRRMLLSRYYGIRARSEESYYQSHKNTVTGMPYLSKDEFMKWADGNIDEFMRLYKAWAEAGYPKRLAPSIDRINNNLGYTKNNLQWLTQSENTSKRFI